MTHEITLHGNLPAGCALGDTYLRLAPGTSAENWVEVARKVTNIGHGYWWWIGDLAHFALHNLEEPQTYLKQLYDATGAGDKYVKMCAFAAQKYAVKDRIRGLSITHHLRAIHLKHGPRQKLLNTAKTKAWSVRVMEQKMRPPERKTITVVLVIPASTQNGFFKQVEALTQQVKGRMRVWGQQRPGATVTKRIAGKGTLRL